MGKKVRKKEKESNHGSNLLSTIHILLTCLACLPMGAFIIAVMVMLDFYPLNPWVFYEAWILGIIIIVLSWQATKPLVALLDNYRKSSISVGKELK